MPAPQDTPFSSRHLRLAGTVNFRDVGGYVGVDDRAVKWETLFRADGLSHLTEPDRAAIRHLGVATVIDLRSSAEIETGSFPVDEVPVTLHHLPLIDEVADPSTFQSIPGFLANSYVEMLETAGPQILRAIEVLADPASQPAIVHCTAGKDRTGVLIALTLGLLGVNDEEIIDDYALSALGMHRLRERLIERYPDAAEAISEADLMFSAAPENMENLLEVIEDRWGSVEGYATHIGISPETIDQLRGSLLEPPPS